MLTGHSERKRVVAARDAGITEFMAKPISANALYQRILNVVANPRPFVKTKTYFGPDRRRNVNPNYVGPERRKGGKADVICQIAFDRQGQGLGLRSGRNAYVPSKDAKAVGRDLRRSRGDHAAQQAAPRSVDCTQQQGNRRSGGTRRAGAGPALERILGLDGHRVRTARRRPSRWSRPRASTRRRTRPCSTPPTTSRARRRPSAFPAVASLADSLCRLIEHTPDMTPHPADAGRSACRRDTRHHPREAPGRISLISPTR